MAVGDADTPGSDEFDRLGICDAFLFKYACRERVLVIAGKDWAGSLEDGRAVVVLFIHEMHGAGAP